MNFEEASTFKVATSYLKFEESPLARKSWEIQSEFRHLCGESTLSFALSCRYYLITQQVCAVISKSLYDERLVALSKSLYDSRNMLAALSLYDERLFAISKSLLDSRNVLAKSLYDERLVALSKSLLDSRNVLGKFFCPESMQNENQIRNQN